MAGITYGDAKNYWIQAGGNPQAAAMAAAVADASSGLDPNITRTNPDGTTSVGLWLIPQNGQPPGSTDPLSNARAAKQLSQNGTDWSQWCVSWSDNNCGQDGGTYLGSGSNALGALGTTNSPYNVIGSTPSGSGVGASAATSSSTTTGASSSKSTTKTTVIYIILIALAVAGAIYFGKRSSQQPAEGVSPETEDEGKSVVVPAHVRRIPNPDRTGPYRPREPSEPRVV